MGRELVRVSDHLPAELSSTVSRMLEMSNGRNMDVMQEREYEIRCANGDRIDISERTAIRIYEVDR